MDLQHTNSWLIYGLLFVICLVIVYVIGFLRGSKSAAQRAGGPPSAPRGSFFGGLFKLVIILALTATMLSLLFYTALLRSFDTFTGKQLAAIVQCQRIKSKEYDFEMQFIPVVNNAIKDTSRFLIKGDQWAVEGNILKWDTAVAFLGLKTMYKLTRVRGRYLSAKKESTEPGSIYALVDEQHTKKWRWLYEYGDKIPLVNSAYGNTVYTYPIPRKEFKIYVTISGLMIEGEELESKGESNVLERLILGPPEI